MTKRREHTSPGRYIRLGWLVLLALVAQLVVVYVGFGEVGVVRRFIFSFSYVLLLAFVLANWRRIGILVIGVGIVMNFLPIVANGGLMPISPDTIVQVGMEEEIADLEPGDPVPLTKNVLLDEDDTYLQWLSDRLTWRSMGPFTVFSVGDTVIAAGLVVTLAELLLPFLQRAFRGRPSLT